MKRKAIYFEGNAIKVVTTLHFLLLAFVGFGQSVKGYVYDVVSNEPLEGASVYFDGSSYGTVTDDKGMFSIELNDFFNAALVVGYLGYQSQKLPPPITTNNLRISLNAETENLDEVVVIAEPFSRKEKLEVFRLEFIGHSKAAEQTKILNEEAIELRYSPKTRTLTAEASGPIMIENSFLRYLVRFDLDKFEIQFKDKSLKRLDNVEQTVFSGSTYYTDLLEANENDDIRERRKLAFLGSPMHFLRACWRLDLEGQGFSIIKGLRKLKTQELIESIALLDLGTKRILFLQDAITINFDGPKGARYRSKLEVQNKMKAVNVDKFGNYNPFSNLRFGGHMAELRLGDMLPIDYNF